jgi:hypothetical protein
LIGVQEDAQAAVLERRGHGQAAEGQQRATHGSRP